MREIMELAKSEQAKFVQRCPDWNGKEVWQLLYDDPDAETMKVGIPILATVKNGVAKLMDDDEVDKYLEQMDNVEDREPMILKVK